MGHRLDLVSAKLSGGEMQRVATARAFAVPIHYYWQHMEQNGLFEVAEAMIADEAFQNDPAIRDAMLADLRKRIMTSPVDPEFEAALMAKLEADYAGIRMRFRSSTNAEDLDGFSGAGIYTSKSGGPNDPTEVLNAVRTVWASLWSFRAYEEWEYRSIDHTGVGMALLVHHAFPFEEANGVAVTANLFDTQGVEPGFYVNVQIGDYSVVAPDPWVTTDQLLLLYTYPGQPVIYLGHSNLIQTNKTVLTRAQILELGNALNAIHEFFAKAYYTGDPGDFYAMDVEFKFDDDWGGDGEQLWIKQARPYPGWGN